MIYALLCFLLWDRILYTTHRLAHEEPWLWKFHSDHHNYVAGGWHWTNLFLIVDTWKSTVDEWLTQLIPTLIFCALLDCWWIAGVYYVWVACFQEWLSHQDRYLFTSGKWHLLHHADTTKNFGAFLPIWDLLEGTHARPQ